MMKTIAHLFLAALFVSGSAYASQEVLADYVILENHDDAVLNTGKEYPSFDEYRRIQTVVTLDNEAKTVSYNRSFTLADATVGVGMPSKPVAGSNPVTNEPQDLYIVYSGDKTATTPPLSVNMLLLGDKAYMHSDFIQQSDITVLTDNRILFSGRAYNDLGDAIKVESGDNWAAVTRAIVDKPIPQPTCDPFAGTSKQAVDGLLDRWLNLYAEDDAGTAEERMARRFNNVGSMFGDVVELRARIGALKILLKGCPKP